MTPEIVGGIIRHALTAVGGYLVAIGALDAATTETAIGALVTLAAIAWSVWTKAREE